MDEKDFPFCHGLKAIKYNISCSIIGNATGIIQDDNDFNVQVKYIILGQKTTAVWTCYKSWPKSVVGSLL